MIARPRRLDRCRGGDERETARKTPAEKHAGDQAPDDQRSRAVRRARGALCDPESDEAEEHDRTLARLRFERSGNDDEPDALAGQIRGKDRPELRVAQLQRARHLRRERPEDRVDQPIQEVDQRAQTGQDENRRGETGLRVRGRHLRSCNPSHLTGLSSLTEDAPIVLCVVDRPSVPRSLFCGIKSKTDSGGSMTSTLKIGMVFAALQALTVTAARAQGAASDTPTDSDADSLPAVVVTAQRRTEDVQKAALCDYSGERQGHPEPRPQPDGRSQHAYRRAAGRIHRRGLTRRSRFDR